MRNPSQRTYQQLRRYLSFWLRLVPGLRPVSHAVRIDGNSKNNTTKLFGWGDFHTNKEHSETILSVISQKIMELYSLFERSFKNIPSLNFLIHPPRDQPLLSSIQVRHRNSQLSPDMPWDIFSKNSFFAPTCIVSKWRWVCPLQGELLASLL